MTPAGRPRRRWWPFGRRRAQPGPPATAPASRPAPATKPPARPRSARTPTPRPAAGQTPGVRVLRTDREVEEATARAEKQLERIIETMGETARARVGNAKVRRGASSPGEPPPSGPESS